MQETPADGGIQEKLDQYPDEMLCQDCLSEKTALIRLLGTETPSQGNNQALSFNPCSICQGKNANGDLLSSRSSKTKSKKSMKNFKIIHQEHTLFVFPDKSELAPRNHVDVSSMSSK
jgi:hypothetical protein